MHIMCLHPPSSVYSSIRLFGLIICENSCKEESHADTSDAVLNSLSVDFVAAAVGLRW